MSNELKRILNLHEEATYLGLREVCEAYGSHVYPKVRVADVLKIEGSGIADDLYRYALQSHFDFVVTNSDHGPVFAVEFDGPTHQSEGQKAGDEKKNGLCARFNFPLLRVTASYFGKKYRDMDLLTWFVVVWFAQKWFEKAQESGQIPYDEPFMPQAILNIQEQSKQFPLWLSADVNQGIPCLLQNGRSRPLRRLIWKFHL